MSHAEETSLVAEGVMNEGHRSAMLGMKGRPTVAEDIAVMREILLAEYADAWVHISHISSKNAIDMVRQAKKRGVRVTAEVTPHHLTIFDLLLLYSNQTYFATLAPDFFRFRGRCAKSPCLDAPTVV